MKEGDKWELTLPSDLAYGNTKQGRIPAGAVLIFELEMLRVKQDTQLLPKINFSIGDLFTQEMLPFWALIGIAMISLRAVARQQESPGGKGEISLANASNETNPRVFFEIDIGGKRVGRVVMELFETVVPVSSIPRSS